MHPVTTAPGPGPGRGPGPPRGQIVLVGAHGGAGTSTLAALLHPAWDTGTLIWHGPVLARLRAAGCPVVLVTGCTVTAAGRAAAAAALLGSGDIRVAVLAVVSDGLPEPAEARYRFRVARNCAAVVRVPFVPAFRAAADPRQVRLPRGTRRALAEIRSLTGTTRAPYPPHTATP